MELYGALKRLVEWNGALVSLVTGSDNDILTHWADMLRADLRSLSDLGSLPLLWRGAINITSTDTVRATDQHPLVSTVSIHLFFVNVYLAVSVAVLLTSVCLSVRPSANLLAGCVIFYDIVSFMWLGTA